MTATLTPATPKKLRNGSWGAIVRGDVAQDVGEGAPLEIIAKSGKRWEAKIVRVVWRGDDAAICATESAGLGRLDIAGGGDHEDCLSFAGCVHGSQNCEYH